MEEKFRELKELMLLGEIDGDELVRRYREFAGIDDEQALAALLKRLKETGFDGSLTIEREITGEQQIKDILETKEYLQKLIDEL